MTLHPEIQALARAELMSVVGSDRLPTPRDRVNLPYIEAVMKEVIRCYPPIPAGDSSRSDLFT